MQLILTAIKYAYSILFPNATKILGVDVRQHEVVRMTPIPIDLFDGTKFTVVSAFLGMFHCQLHIWNTTEWIFFLEEIAKHHRAADARVYFYMNHCTTHNGTLNSSAWSKDTINILERMGASFTKSSTSIRTMHIMDLTNFRN